MTYLLDANVFIDAKRRYYGFETCPGFWDWLDWAHQGGGVLSIEAVRDELVGFGDELSDWVRQRQGMFADVDADVLRSLGGLSTWVNSQQYRPSAINTFLQGADYYLVGHAHAKKLTVVTLEVPSNEVTRVKIPTACVGMGVKYATPFQMLRSMQARFILQPDGARASSAATEEGLT